MTDKAKMQNTIDVLTAQLEAYREQLNESLSAGLIAKTNIILLKKQVEDANKRIAELTPVVTQTEVDAA